VVTPRAIRLKGGRKFTHFHAPTPPQTSPLCLCYSRFAPPVSAVNTVFEFRGMEQRFLLYQHNNGACPYLEGKEWVSHAFYAEMLNPLLYEQLISKGFRRSGTVFYQNHCPGCTHCKPIVVDVQRFSPSPSQRRVLRKNRDIAITRNPVSFEKGDFVLYRTYIEHRHPSSSVPTPESYINFLIESPVPTEIMRYYRGDHLVGLAWIDLLPHSLSSVYFAFDPAYSSRSLGTYSILRQIALAQELRKEWLQLGFWVKESRKMSYKSHFKPCYILVEGEWKEFLTSSLNGDSADLLLSLPR